MKIIPLFGKEKATLFHILISWSSKIICWPYFPLLILNYLDSIFKSGQHVLQECLAKLVILGNASRIKYFCGDSRQHLDILIRDENPCTEAMGPAHGAEVRTWPLCLHVLTASCRELHEASGQCFSILIPLCSFRGPGHQCGWVQKAYFFRREFCMFMSFIVRFTNKHGSRR